MKFYDILGSIKIMLSCCDFILDRDRKTILSCNFYNQLNDRCFIGWLILGMSVYSLKLIEHSVLMNLKIMLIRKHMQILLTKFKF